MPSIKESFLNIFPFPFQMGKMSYSSSLVVHILSSKDRSNLLVIFGNNINKFVICILNSTLNVINKQNYYNFCIYSDLVISTLNFSRPSYSSYKDVSFFGIEFVFDLLLFRLHRHVAEGRFIDLF